MYTAPNCQLLPSSALMCLPEFSTTLRSLREDVRVVRLASIFQSNIRHFMSKRTVVSREHQNAGSGKYVCIPHAHNTAPY